MPAVFVIDGVGTVRFVHSNSDYKVRIATEDLLEAAQAAQE